MKIKVFGGNGGFKENGCSKGTFGKNFGFGDEDENCAFGIVVVRRGLLD